MNMTKKCHKLEIMLTNDLKNMCFSHVLLSNYHFKQNPLKEDICQLIQLADNLTQSLKTSSHC